MSTISYIKALAIAQLGGIAISDAVLTVPPNAFDKERQCLKAAAQSAGINILRILNAPISACVGHGLDKLNGEVIYKIVVIDLGAAALRVSMLALEEGIFEIEYHEDGPTLDWSTYENPRKAWTKSDCFACRFQIRRVRGWGLG